MSYARFGQDGSDVYVFLDCSGFLACCGCSLAQPVHDTTADMLAHLDAHKAAGHTVLDSCIEGLIEEAAENDAWIATGGVADVTHASENVEVWAYPDGLADIFAWSCNCDPVDGIVDHAGGYPTLRAALEAALVHVTEAEAT